MALDADSRLHAIVRCIAARDFAKGVSDPNDEGSDPSYGMMQLTEALCEAGAPSTLSTELSALYRECYALQKATA